MRPCQGKQVLRGLRGTELHTFSKPSSLLGRGFNWFKAKLEGDAGAGNMIAKWGISIGSP
jgi:hypothetical protein